MHRVHPHAVVDLRDLAGPTERTRGRERDGVFRAAGFGKGVLEVVGVVRGDPCDAALVVHERPRERGALVAAGDANVGPRGADRDGLAEFGASRVVDLAQLKAVAKAACGAGVGVLRVLEDLARPAVEGEPGGVVGFDGLDELLVAPRAAVAREVVVLVFHEDRRHGGEVVGPVRVEPPGVRLEPRGNHLRSEHEDRVVAEAEAAVARVLHQRDFGGGARVGRAGLVVDAQERRVREDAAVQVVVDVERRLGVASLRLHLASVGAGVPLAPHADRPDVHERHVGLAVVAARHGLEEIFELLEEHGIAVVGFPDVGLRTRRILPVYFGHLHLEEPALGAGVLDPFGRRVGVAGFAARDAERDLLAGRDPRGGVAVEEIPAVLSLLRFQEAPGQAEVDGGDAGEPVEHVAAPLELSVGPLPVRVVEQDEAHVRVDKDLVRVLRLDGHGLRGAARGRHDEGECFLHGESIP